MDITFPKLFNFSDDVRQGQEVTRPTPGESRMLNHRSEAKQEEPNVYSVDNSAPMRQKVETKVPTAVIGPKIRFKGELVGEEDLLVQGQVEGTIDLKGHHLTVGEQGVLRANVSAKTITVEGRVDGDLLGEECVAIRASSHVQGNIKAERVILEDGAKFRGSIDMDMDFSDDKINDVKAMSSQLKGTGLSKEKHFKKPEEGV